MKLFKIIGVILWCLTWAIPTYGQEEVSVESEGHKLYGTLQGAQFDHVVLFIAGSGPTDRNGNQPGHENNCLKMIADSLEVYGIASLRYDKRGIASSSSTQLDMRDLRFEHLVADAGAWCKLLSTRFDRISIIGHSQGALVGFLAAQNHEVYRFVSLAGLATSMYETLQRQLSNQPKFVTDVALPMLDSLASGVKVDSVPPYLNSLFNPGLQDYLISALHFDSRKEITKLDIPVLVVQGTTDIQITVIEAQQLAAQSTNVEITVIEGMNHVLKPAPEAPITNYATYNQPQLPLHEALIPALIRFIKQ